MGLLRGLAQTSEHTGGAAVFLPPRPLPAPPPPPAAAAPPTAPSAFPSDRKQAQQNASLFRLKTCAPAGEVDKGTLMPKDARSATFTQTLTSDTTKLQQTLYFPLVFLSARTWSDLLLVVAPCCSPPRRRHGNLCAGGARTRSAARPPPGDPAAPPRRAPNTRSERE